MIVNILIVLVLYVYSQGVDDTSECVQSVATDRAVRYCPVHRPPSREYRLRVSAKRDETR